MSTLASIEVEIDDEVDPATYNVEFRMTTPPVPAQLYGPPENCYPAEGAEFEYHQISRRENGKWYPCVAGEYDTVVAHCSENMYDEMLDAANTQGE